MTRVGSISVLLVLAMATPLAAQAGNNTEDVLGFFHFSFSNPGARSLRLGGAFTAIADNATAAYSNPAGLMNISRREVSLEGKRATYATVYTDRGHGQGEPTGIGLDTIAGIEEGRSEGTVTTPAFVSAVVPTRNWSFAVYRHELANFRSSFETGGIFVGGDSLLRVRPTKTEIDATIVTYAVAGAWRLLDTDANRLSIGASLGRTSLALTSSTRRFDTNLFFGPPSDLHFTNIIRGEGAALNGSAGILWRHRLAESKYLRLGAVYRHGPGFDVVVETIGAPGSPFEGVHERASARMNIPGIIGTGVALEMETTTFSIDVNRVGYEQLVDDVANTFETDNGYEIRVGVERVFPFVGPRGGAHAIVLGIGAWRDPDHRLAYRDQTRPEALIYRRGNDDYHLTGGISVPVSSLVTIDAAIDRSDRQRIVSISAVIQLPRTMVQRNQ
jgi:long-chain fatty acid transport protein